ncbi:hypothetical protein FACS189459_7190 [Bacilli bacterium]|nr:hypothetical protein FACS189459_7190 [Bacilli bacterium]
MSVVKLIKISRAITTGIVGCIVPITKIPKTVTDNVNVEDVLLRDEQNNYVPLHKTSRVNTKKIK